MIPEKHQHIVRKGEKILYYVNPYSSKKFLLKISLGVITIVIVSIIIGGLLLPPEDFGNVFLLLPLSLIILGSIGYFFDDSYSPSSYKHYIITDKRIYFVNKLINEYLEYDFHYIYKLERKTDRLILYSFPSNEPGSHDKRLKNVLDVSALKRQEQNHIYTTWFKNSHYQIINNRFEAISKRYNLNFSPFKLDAASIRKLELSGMINGIEILISIGAVDRVRTVAFAFRCPNGEQNYLLIKKEGEKEKWAKKLGMQDIQTNNIVFDNHFLLQSNNQAFFDFVMTEETQMALTSAWRDLNGVLRMGKTAKMPKIIEKKEKHLELDSFILDEHLANAPKSNNKEVIRGFTTPLVYYCNDIHITPLSRNPQLLGKKLVVIFETMLNIALKIQEYNNQIQS